MSIQDDRVRASLDALCYRYPWLIELLRNEVGVNGPIRIALMRGASPEEALADTVRVLAGALRDTRAAYQHHVERCPSPVYITAPPTAAPSTLDTGKMPGED